MVPRIRRVAASAAVAALGCAAFAVPLGPGEAVVVTLAENGSAGNGGSYEGAVSNNGRFVAFYSDADNLGPADGNGNEDVFVKDLKTGAVELLSQDDAGNGGNNNSEYPAISANGRWVLYYTGATNLAPGAVEGDQVVVTDRKTGITTEVSAPPGDTLADGNCDLYDARPLSGNGRWAVFQSSSTNLVPGDGNGMRDVFLADLRKGTLERITNGIAGEADGNSRYPSISPNGRWVVFVSQATNLVPTDDNGVPDVFLYDVKKRTTSLVSRATNGNLGNLSSYDFAPAVSNNGRRVAFNSRSTNLDADAADAGADADVFLRDLKEGTTRRISFGFMGAEPDADCGSVGIAPNGKLVTYWTYASNMFEAADALPYDQVVHDVATGTNRRMLEATTGGSPDGGTYGYGNGFSANGRWFVATSDASDADPDDGNAESDVFRLDLK